MIFEPSTFFKSKMILKSGNESYPKTLEAYISCRISIIKILFCPFFHQYFRNHFLLSTSNLRNAESRMDFPFTIFMTFESWNNSDFDLLLYLRRFHYTIFVSQLRGRLHEKNLFTFISYQKWDQTPLLIKTLMIWVQVGTPRWTGSLRQPVQAHLSQP